MGWDRTVNTIVVDGPELTLVDVGIRLPEALSLIERGLTGLGRSIAAVDRIVITHPHHDHFGAAAEIVRRSGARVIGDGVAVMAGFPESFRPNALFQRDLFLESGAPDDIGRHWVEQIERLAQDAEPVVAEPLNAGETLALGGADWQVISTPGHAASSICLFQPDERLLMSGDILLGNGASNVTLHRMARPGRWLLDILDSLELLAGLDVSIAYPGHGPMIVDGGAVIRSRQRRARERLDQVEAMVREHPRSAFDVSRAIYPPAIGTTSLGLSQALGYLEALVALGRATSHLRHGRRMYASI